MYFSSGYLNNNKLPFKDKSKPLIVGSCGTYRLKTKKKLPAWPPIWPVPSQPTPPCL